MIARLLAFLFLSVGGIAIQAIPPQRTPMDLKEFVTELRHLSNNHETEIRTLEEKIANHEEMIEVLQKELKTSQKLNQENLKTNSMSLEQRLSKAETTSEMLAKDLTSIKEHLEKQNNLILSLNNKVSSIDSILTQQAGNITHLQSAMKTLTEAFQEPGTDTASTYKVQPKDTLGGIALKFGVTMKALREENKLSSDKIIVGQTLSIPQKSP